MKAEQFAKLPKWAQEEFNSLGRQLKETQADLLDMAGEEETAISVTVQHGRSYHDDVKRYLPENNDIEFKLGDRAKINVYLQDGKLRVMATGYPMNLNVRPNASNLVFIDCQE